MNSQEPITPTTSQDNGQRRETSTDRSWEIFHAIAESKHIVIEIMKDTKSELRHRLNVLQELIGNLIHRIDERTAASKMRSTRIAEFFDQMAFSIANNFNLMENNDLFIITPISAETKNEDSEETILKESIGQFDREFKKYSLRAKELQEAIKGKISKSVLSEGSHLEEERVRLAGLALTDIANKIQKSAQRLDRKFNELLKIAREGFSTVDSRKRPKVNFLDKLLSFTRCSKRLRDFATDYSGAFFEALDVHQELETRRLATIKTSFLGYLEILNQFYGRSANGIFGLSQKMFEGLNENLLSKNQFDLYLLLSPSEKELILRTTGFNTINKSVLRAFFSNQINKDELTPFLHSFVRNSFDAKHLNSQMVLSPVEIYLSTDYYISICEHNADDEKEKLIKAIPVEDIQEITKYDESTIFLKYIQRGRLWDSRRELRLEFQPQTASFFLNELREQSQLIKTLVGEKLCGSPAFTEPQSFSDKKIPAISLNNDENTPLIKSKQANENKKTKEDDNSVQCEKEMNNFSAMTGSTNWLDPTLNINESAEIDSGLCRTNSRTNQSPNNRSVQNVGPPNEVNLSRRNSPNSQPGSPSERV